METTERTKPLFIGAVARRAGIGVETVRFYERQGLIGEPPRTAARYRQYPENVVARLRFIKRAKALGFSLREIDELLALRLDPRADQADVKGRATAKITEIDAKVGDLQRMKRALAGLVRACSGRGAARDCPILEALSGVGLANGSNR